MTRQAVLPAAAVAGFLSRIDFKDGAAPETSTGAPRGVWSNSDWKTAFLKGVMDAAAEVDAEPSLKLLGMSERMLDSVRKLLGSAGVEFKPVDGGLVVAGEAAVRRYAEHVGSHRPQIKDLLAPYAPATPAQAPKASVPKAKKEGRPEGRRGRRRGRAPERPQPQTQGQTPAPAPQPASAPEPYVEPSDFLPPRENH